MLGADSPYKSELLINQFEQSYRAFRRRRQSFSFAKVFPMHANGKPQAISTVNFTYLPLTLMLLLYISLSPQQMQAYRDNFKQTPCPAVVDLQGPSLAATSSSASRLPFSRNRGRGELNNTGSSSTNNINNNNNHNQNHSNSNANGAITPRMMSPAPVAPAAECSTNALLRQNQELRQRLADESHSYRRRLDTYKQAQHNQANLVSRLQSKIQQYRQRCSDLEDRMHDTIKPTVTAPCAPKLTTGPTASQVLVSLKKDTTFYMNLMSSSL